jgi:hypothetical protein
MQMRFGETSAKNGVNVEETINELVKAIVEKGEL